MTRISSALCLIVIGLASSKPALAQCTDGTPPPCGRPAPRPAAPAPSNSIAVLYFDNLSRDTADVYLADGFSEEVISRLSQVERLQVKSRFAVRRYRGREMENPTTVGRALSVAHLVSGSILRAGNRVRVTIELTRVATGNSVWSRSFDRTADDLIRTEAEIAESVAVNVGARLAPAERQAIEAQPTRNAAAYDHLLRGRFESTRRTTASLQRAVREFEEAIRLDPALVPALVGAGFSYMQLGNLYYSPEIGMSRDTAMARGRTLVDRALRLDSSSAEAWLARASIQRGAEGRASLARAAAAGPRNADAHHGYALGLRIIGDDSGAIREFRRAVEIEPERTISLLNLGQTYLLTGRIADARRWIDSAVALGPEASFFYMEKALVHLLHGDTMGGWGLATEVATHGSRLGAEIVYALLESRAGDSAAAHIRLIRVDSARAGLDCFASHECLELSFGLASVGLRERALRVFERLRPRDGWIASWSRRPEFDPIRDDPRFQVVVAEGRANRDR